LATLRATKKAYFTPNNTHTPSLTPNLTPNLTPGLIDTSLYSRRRSRSEHKPDLCPKSREANTQYQNPEQGSKSLNPAFYPQKVAFKS